jgi:hypothetical protein
MGELGPARRTLPPLPTASHVSELLLVVKVAKKIEILVPP